MSNIIECCGCGRFRTAAPKSDPTELDSCVECNTQGAKGRVWDSYRRTYVSLDSQHDVYDGFDDDTHDGGRRSDAAGRL